MQEPLILSKFHGQCELFSLHFRIAGNTPKGPVIGCSNFGRPVTSVSVAGAFQSGGGGGTSGGGTSGNGATSHNGGVVRGAGYVLATAGLDSLLTLSFMV
jgi:hypothetical protein